MFEKTALRWPPQPSTVIGLGVLAGSFFYLVTGDPFWAGVVGATVKILVPDNSAGAGQVVEAIAILAQPVAKLLRAGVQPTPVASGGQGCDPQSIRREPPEK
jgi:hypothetical protein